MKHQLLMAVLLLMISFLPPVILAQDSQPHEKVQDVLIHRYGDTVKWTVTGGVITYWEPSVVAGKTQAPLILKPTPTQLSTWIQEDPPPAMIEGVLPPAVLPPAVVPVVDPALDPTWRALITALCLMNECENEAAIWTAFQAALP